MMRVRILQILALLLFTAGAASAQAAVKNPKSQLEQYFERKRVKLKIDMPADKKGIDITPEADVKMDDSETARRKDAYRISIRKDDEPLITKVIIAAKTIEILLGEGGYDPPSYSANPGPFEKTAKAKDLIVKINQSTGEKKKHYQNLYAAADRDHQKLIQKHNKEFANYNSYKRQGRLIRGSRFILRFRETNTSMVTPEELMKWLEPYVDFSRIIKGEPPEPEPRPGTPINPIKPYFGKWQTGSGEQLWIETGSLNLNSTVMKYREVCRMAAENIFAIER